jgi:hypothetical protein
MNQLLRAFNFSHVFWHVSFGRQRLVLNIKFLKFFIRKLRLYVPQIAAINLPDCFVVQLMGLLAPNNRFVDQRKMNQKSITKLDDKSHDTIANFGPQTRSAIGMFVVATGQK